MAEHNAAPDNDGSQDDRRRGDNRGSDPHRSRGGGRPPQRGGPRRDDRRGPRRDDDKRGSPRRDDRPRRDADRRPAAAPRPEKPYRPGDAHRDDSSSGAAYRPGQDRRADRLPEPPLPEEITGKELDRSIASELRTLSKDTAERISKHLVAAGVFVSEGDLETASKHSAFAVRLGGRVGAVRETHGVVAYNQGDFAAASREFRAARRITGRPELLPLIADCERGLGRPEKALQLAEDPDVERLSADGSIELTIVMAGAYADMGDLETALRSLEIPALRRKVDGEWKVRLWVAYARLLERAERTEEAEKWLRLAADADPHGITDARETLGIPEVAAAEADVAWGSNEEVGVVDTFEEEPEAEPGPEQRS